ncbi:hypothetical protein OWV82_020315 [Melia azedarach]|uniref:Uncharacterized protein n=1 Tax=Melia azedarach TaxID=155640 RepID=A0ACC1X5G2_MELAZ|nr:hypothetical protein OWV82_020315 [Melia azedarach]
MMTSTCSNNKGEFEHVVNRGPVKKATHREKWIKGTNVRIETKHITITSNWLYEIVDRNMWLEDIVSYIHSF